MNSEDEPGDESGDVYAFRIARPQQQADGGKR